MERYNVLKLFIVKSDSIYYICKKVNESYIDIFLNEEIETDYKDDIKHLAIYYIVEVMDKIAKGEEFYLTKRELLNKFAELNAFNIYKREEFLYKSDFLSYQEEYLAVLKEVQNNTNKTIKKLNLKADNLEK